MKIKKKTGGQSKNETNLKVNVKIRKEKNGGQSENENKLEVKVKMKKI